MRMVLASAKRWAVMWLGLLVFVSVVWVGCEIVQLIERMV